MRNVPAPAQEILHPGPVELSGIKANFINCTDRRLLVELSDGVIACLMPNDLVYDDTGWLGGLEELKEA